MSEAWSSATGLKVELERLGRTHLVMVDEVGYIPFDPEARAVLR